jgi:chromosome transmission fidelity protein 1
MNARTIILAGGTMQPMSHFRSQLFDTIPEQNIHEFSCGHVIEPSNVLALSLTVSPNGTKLCFDYNTRNDIDMIRQLGIIIVNLCKVMEITYTKAKFIPLDYM